METSRYAEVEPVPVSTTLPLSSGSGDHHHQHEHDKQQPVQRIPQKQQNGTTTTVETKATNGQLRPAKTTAPMTKDKDNSTQSVAMLLVIFAVSALALCYVYFMFPRLDEAEKEHVKFPFNIEDAKQLAKVLDRYKDLYYLEVMGGIILAYIFLQAFAIPGSLFLSILSGFLFHFAVALPLVCFCSAFGATLCYLLSQVAGRRLVKKFFPERSEKWALQIEEHKENLFNYMLFLRMTPILPNWFINLVAPVIGVPLAPFALGTFFGVAPPSVIAIQAGKTLHTMTSSSEAFSWRSMLILGVLATLSIVPSLFKKKLKAKLA